MIETFHNFQLSVTEGQRTLGRQVEAAKKRKDHDDIFDQVKGAVVETAISKHVWEEKAAEVLKVIQLNTLEDR